MAITTTERRLGGGIFHVIASGATQADGAFTVSFSFEKGDVRSRCVQVQVEVVGSPTTGSLAIAVRSPGASNYATLSETVDLVNGPLFYVLRDVVVDAMRFTPTSFNGTSYNVIITAF